MNSVDYDPLAIQWYDGRVILANLRQLGSISEGVCFTPPAEIFNQ